MPEQKGNSITTKVFKATEGVIKKITAEHAKAEAIPLPEPVKRTRAHPPIVLSEKQQAALTQVKRAADPSLPPEVRWPEAFVRDPQHGFLRLKNDPNRTLTDNEAVQIIEARSPKLKSQVVIKPPSEK